MSVSREYLFTLPKRVSTIAEAEIVFGVADLNKNLAECVAGTLQLTSLLDVRTTIRQLEDFPGFPSAQIDESMCPACLRFKALIEKALKVCPFEKDVRCSWCGVEEIESCMKLRDWAVKHDLTENPRRVQSAPLPIPASANVHVQSQTLKTSQLPDPLLYNVWSFLPLSFVLASVQHVCRTWHDHISCKNNPQMTRFWRQQGLHYLALLLATTHR